VALGGPGGVGGNGGPGQGGGLSNLTEPGYPPTTLTVTGTTVAHNQAQGGAAGVKGSGGDGQGGGLYGDATSVLTLSGATVTYNLAVGTAPAGQGIGGGVYHLGTFSLDGATVIDKNHASTSNDGVGP
jgi:hypothetical protein